MRRFIISFLCLLLLAPISISLAAAEGETAAGAVAPPNIEIPESHYDFGEAFEDENAIHPFTIRNTGGSPLIIERVAVSCGCTVAEFDKEIPAGGEGKVTINVRLKGFKGDIKKTATIMSNDPDNARMSVTVVGKVKTYLDAEPSHVYFRGSAEDLQPVEINLTSQAGPFKVTGVESNLDEFVTYEIKEVKAGEQYRMVVANKANKGKYNGQINITTDQPKWPRLTVRVLGTIEGKVSIRPTTLYVGRFREDSPPIEGRVTIKHGQNKDFKITRLEYDESLLSVTQEPAKTGKAIILRVAAHLDNVTGKDRRTTEIKLETDAEPGEVQTIRVEIANL